MSSGGEFVNSNQISNGSASNPILPNCGPGAASSGCEFVNSSQISTVGLSSSSSSLVESNLSLDINVDHYGSTVPSDGPPSVVDSVMTKAPDPCKWPISETSSDDAPKSKNRNKKMTKKGGRSSSHLPISIATAVRSIASSRVLAKR